MDSQKDNGTSSKRTTRPGESGRIRVAGGHIGLVCQMDPGTSIINGWEPLAQSWPSLRGERKSESHFHFRSHSP